MKTALKMKVIKAEGSCSSFTSPRTLVGIAAVVCIYMSLLELLTAVPRSVESLFYSPFSVIMDNILPAPVIVFYILVILLNIVTPADVLLHLDREPRLSLWISCLMTASMMNMMWVFYVHFYIVNIDDEHDKYKNIWMVKSKFCLYVAQMLLSIVRACCVLIAGKYLRKLEKLKEKLAAKVMLLDV